MKNPQEKIDGVIVVNGELWTHTTLGDECSGALQSLFHAWDVSQRARDNYRRKWQCLTESERDLLELEGYYRREGAGEHIKKEAIEALPIMSEKHYR